VVFAPYPCEVLATAVHPFPAGSGDPVMAIPAMIFPALGLRDGEDLAGEAAAAAFGVEDLVLTEPRADGGVRPG